MLILPNLSPYAWGLKDVRASSLAHVGVEAAKGHLIDPAHPVIIDIGPSLASDKDILERNQIIMNNDTGQDAILNLAVYQRDLKTVRMAGLVRISELPTV